MSAISAIARKYRRALRNGKGTRFSLDELQALADEGALEMLQAAEARELKDKWAAKPHLTSSETSGSINAAMGSRPMSGKLLGMTRRPDPSAILALVSGD